MQLANYIKINTAMNRVMSEGPAFPRCSDNKTAAITKPFINATRYPYIQVNRKNMVSWLIFDLDHPNALIWEDNHLPAPNLIVRNQGSGTSHLFYAISPVSTSENSRSKPIQYMKAIYAAFCEKLNADPSYSGPVAKTPGHPWWCTTEFHNHEYSLSELHDYVELNGYGGFRKPKEESIHSRHCILFDELRYYAYGLVEHEKKLGTFNSFVNKLTIFAETHNSFTRMGFSANLSWSQVKATVKSVSRWTWDRYTGSAKVRGTMRFDDSALPLKEKQSQSAKRTHNLKTSRSVEKLVFAFSRAHTGNELPTITELTKASGLCRQTVSRHYEKAKSIYLKSHPARREQSNKASSVNFGVHQIYAVAPVDNSQDVVAGNVCVKERQFMNIIDDELADSAHSDGAGGAKNDFSSLCRLFASIPKIEKVPCPFSYKFRGRLARIVLKEKLTLCDSELVAVSVAAVCVDPKTEDWSEDQWAGYCAASARNARFEKLQRFEPLLHTFRSRCKSSEVFLTDHEYSLYRDFLEMSKKKGFDDGGG